MIQFYEFGTVVHLKLISILVDSSDPKNLVFFLLNANLSFIKYTPYWINMEILKLTTMKRATHASHSDYEVSPSFSVDAQHKIFISLWLHFDIVGLAYKAHFNKQFSILRQDLLKSLTNHLDCSRDCRCSGD